MNAATCGSSQTGLSRLALAPMVMHAEAMSAFASLLFASVILVNGGRDPMPGNDPATDDPCGAGQLAALIGAPVPEALEDLPVPGPVRVIRPGQRITMDHIPQRLNIELDADGIVTGLRCG